MTASSSIVLKDFLYVCSGGRNPLFLFHILPVLIGVGKVSWGMYGSKKEQLF